MLEFEPVRLTVLSTYIFFPRVLTSVPDRTMTFKVHAVCASSSIFARLISAIVDVGFAVFTAVADRTFTFK